jgi:DNA-directed RNA polymerase subunit RPC12/RpoP
MVFQMDIGLFDNYEDDGQLSLFRYEDQYPDEFGGEDAGGEEKPENDARMGLPGTGSAGIRIRRCTSCGKLLNVKEEAEGFAASCSNCGIRYFQKA